MPASSRPRRTRTAALAAPFVLITLAGAARPASRAPALTGLYLQNQSIGRGDVWNYYYFWPDGHVCHTMPRGGMDPAPSYAAVAAQAPGECGTFALRGNQLALQLAGKPAASLRLDNVDASGFALSGFPTIRVPAFPAGARLDGRWHSLYFKGDDYRDVTWTFTRDGRFAYDEHSIRTMYSSPPVRSAGTYTLGGNTLQLSTGQRMTAHGFPAAGDRRLSLDGTVMQPAN